VTSALDQQAARVVDQLRGATEAELAIVQRLGDADAWLLRRGPDLLVLKPGRPEQDEADVTWEHDHLRRLQRTGFPAPVPIPSFDGWSWARVDGRIWATLTYLPGRTLASEADPDMEAAGAFLARYHCASRLVPAAEQRPTSSGLTRLREVTPREPLRTALGSADALDQFERLLTDLEAGLRELRYETLEQLVIHGDATNDNVIVDGDPPRIVGLIDFGAASLAPWPADLAAALWRSGRRVDRDVGLDPDHVRRFVRGYHRESLIPRHLAHAIPLLIQARGLMLVSRRVRRFPERLAEALDYATLSLTRTSWVHDHRRELTDAIDQATQSDDESRRTSVAHG
jgi:Ser/Thr protein kinase RdoA (MazF antagonist)